MLIIGIHGKKRSGKDTAAKALVGAGWRHSAFADALRQGLLALNPLVDRGVQLSDVIAEYGWEGVKDSPYADEVRRPQPGSTVPPTWGRGSASLFSATAWSLAR